MLSLSLSAPRAEIRATCREDGTVTIASVASPAAEPYKRRLAEEVDLVGELLLGPLCRGVWGNPGEPATRTAREAAIVSAMRLGGAVMVSRSTGKLLGRWHVDEGVRLLLSPVTRSAEISTEMDDEFLLEVASLLADPYREGVLCDCAESELPLRAKAVKGYVEVPRDSAVVAPDNGGLLVKVVRLS